MRIQPAFTDSEVAFDLSHHGDAFVTLYSTVQKEMQTKFAEISEITRISAIKLRTFASDEKAAKFRCFYCSHVGEISQAG